MDGDIVESQKAGAGKKASPMRIGMVVHAYYLKDARVRRYAELLAGQGHEVDVLCLREGDEPKVVHHMGVNIYRIDTTRMRGGRLSYIYEYLDSFVRFFFALNARTWKAGKYDVLHIHNMPDFLVFCALFQRLGGTPVILDIHDLMSEVYQSKFFLQPNHWLPRLLRIEEKISTRFASALITANHAFADILGQRSVSASKVKVVMNAASEMFFLDDKQLAEIRKSKKPGDFHVIYIGTMAPRYGVENAVKAIAKLHHEGSIPGLRFSIIPKIANEGVYVDEVLAEIESSGVSDIFTMMDPVPHDTMPAVIAEADTLIYTPLPDIHMDIALSLKIPEAIAVGLPVVASSLSVNMRYFGEEGLFTYTPGDVDGCAARVLEVYQDKAATAAKIVRAREKLEEISWAKQADVYMKLVREMHNKTR